MTINQDGQPTRRQALSMVGMAFASIPAFKAGWGATIPPAKVEGYTPQKWTTNTDQVKMINNDPGTTIFVTLAPDTNPTAIIKSVESVGGKWWKFACMPCNNKTNPRVK